MFSPQTMGFVLSLLVFLSTQTRHERFHAPTNPMLLRKAEKIKIEFAGIEAANEIRIRFNGKPRPLGAKDCIITPTTTVLAVQMADTTTARLTTGSLEYRQNYSIAISGIGEKPLLPTGILDDFYSEKPLGHHLENDNSVFRLFAPRATKVRLFVFERHDQENGSEQDMRRDDEGVWEFFAKENLAGKYYGYSVGGPAGAEEMFDAATIIADPYSRAVATCNEVAHPGRTLILPPDNFDWRGDSFTKIPMEDLIIYEMHVRDLTAHPSSGVSPELYGSYRGLIESGKTGGMDYIKSLGVNAIELLPVQDFGNLELLPPAADGKQAESGWQQNHWGYMTSHFFAPESYYATGGTLKFGAWAGEDGRQARELKEVVRVFHQNGIAVILDVVYNHVSQYNQNSFKYIDKKYYFRLDGDGEFLNKSGCFNDFKTERPMSRRMILDSVEYWMREFHIDGFRFDLAAMIDWETCDAILKKAREINP